MKKFYHPDPEIERLANKHYEEDPETRRAVDDIMQGSQLLQEPLIYDGYDEMKKPSTKSLYDICTDLVKRHRELKSYTLDNYGQDGLLTIYLDELEESMAVFEEQMTEQKEKDLQNAKS